MHAKKEFDFRNNKCWYLKIWKQYINYSVPPGFCNRAIATKSTIFAIDRNYLIVAQIVAVFIHKICVI